MRWRLIRLPSIQAVSGGATPAGGGGGASYAYKGNVAKANAGSGTLVFPAIDIGSPISTTVLLVGVDAADDPSSFTSLTCNSNTLTPVSGTTIIGGSGHSLTFYSGVGTSFGSGSQVFTLVQVGNAPNGTVLHVWTLDGLTSTSPKAGGGAAPSFNIAVNAGDFLFSVIISTVDPDDYASSTVAPSNIRQGGIFAGWSGADWAITSTNAAFKVEGHQNFFNVSGCTFA